MILYQAILKQLTVSEWRVARKTFLRLFPILLTLREHWWKQITISAIAFLLVPIGLINPYLTSLMVDGPLLNRSMSEFLKYGVMIGVVTIGTLLIQNLVTYLHNRSAAELNEAITRQIYLKLTNFSLDFFRGSHRERNTNILGGDGVEVAVWSLSFIPQLFITILTVITRIAVVFWIDWRLGLTILLSPPFYLIKANIAARRNRLMARVQRETSMAYGKELRDSLGSVDVMKTFRTERYHADRVFSALERVTTLNKKSYRFELIFNSLSGLLIKILDAVPLLIGAILVTKGQITLGELSATLMYVGQTVAANSQLIDLIPSLASKSVSVNVFNDFLRQKPSIQESVSAKDVDFGGADIVLENVSFSYIPQLPVLENLSLTIRAGEWTGIKAPSGYGKTTLLNLILRLYDVQAGRITIGGYDVREIRFRAFADQISIVMQQMFFSRDSLRRAIAYDKQEASLSEVREAARLAGIDGFIMGLPKGYDTQCGDAASRLSQGQRQRIMIARALLRKPKILIMDESFGSVDKETEDRIVAHMKATFPEMTVIVVSHHDTVLQKMDRVIDLTADHRMRAERMRGYFRVNYFDLGTHLGQEIDILLEQLKDHPLVGEIHVYGIEANPLYYKKALEKYQDRPGVHFIFENFAVSSQSGTTRLYLHPNDLGHSIYPDKWNVSSESIAVPAMRFSDWMRSAVPTKDARTFSILKANIEGAEWDLINDLEKNSLFRQFDLYLSSKQGFYKDIAKVKSLADQGAPAKCQEILRTHGIHIQQFCHTHQKTGGNINIGIELSRKARAIEMDQQRPGAALVQ